MSVSVFAYGLLQHREVLTQLFLGLEECEKSLSGLSFEPASLSGFARRTLQFDSYPPCAMAVEDASSTIKGVLVSGVSKAQLEVMDAFEMLDEGIYRRSCLTVELESGEQSLAEVYLTGAKISDEALGGDWDEAEFMRRYYRAYVEKVVPEFAEEAGRLAAR